MSVRLHAEQVAKHGADKKPDHTCPATDHKYAHAASHRRLFRQPGEDRAGRKQRKDATHDAGDDGRSAAGEQKRDEGHDATGHKQSTVCSCGTGGADVFVFVYLRPDSKQFALGVHAHILAGCHRHRTGGKAGDAGHHDRFGGELGTGHAHDQPKVGHDAVLDAKHGSTDGVGRFEHTVGALGLVGHVVVSVFHAVKPNVCHTATSCVTETGCSVGLLWWHVAASWWLVGVGMTVTLVQYPTFRLIPAEQFVTFHQKHSAGMSVAVALPWLTQGVTAVLLLTRGERLVQVAVAASAVAVLLTIFAVVPQHARLATGFDDTAYGRLILWDRVRLVAFVLHATVVTGVAFYA